MDMRDEMISWRRDFHQYPELGFQEKRTSGIIAQRMEDWGFDVQRGVAETGVVAYLEGKEQGRVALKGKDYIVQEGDIVHILAGT